MAGRPLIFSGNSNSNEIQGYTFPADMPEVRWPKLSGSCDPAEAIAIRKAWVFAHYYTWRAAQVIQYIAEADREYRGRLWGDG